MPRKSRWFPIIPLALLASLACSVFSGGGGGTETAATDTQPAGGGATREKMGTLIPDAAATETPKPADDGKDYLGDYHEAEGMVFAALELADPAEPGPIYEGVEAMRLVGVRIIVGNLNGDRLYFSPSDVGLKDANGDMWESEYGALDGEVIGAYLDPGQRVQGWIGFTIPENVQPVELEYLYDWMDEKSIIVSLAEPPAGREPRTVDFSRAQFSGPGLGQAAAGGEFAVTVIQVEDPAEPAFPDFFDPPPATHLLAVEIEVKNVSDKVQTFSTFEINLVDADGFLYVIDYFNGPEVIDSDDLEPGGSVTGWVTFLVPDGTVPESIRFFTIGMEEPLYAGVGE
jgi:hypothetical protein